MPAILAHRARILIVTGLLLVFTAGNAGQPHLLLDINPLPVTTLGPAFFEAATTWAYFYADDGTHGEQPWVSDGTALGTFFWASTAPQGANTVGYPSLHVGNKIYLAVSTLSGDTMTYVSDGTKAGSYPLGLVTSDPNWVDSGPVGTLGTQLVFSAVSLSTGGHEFWIADGLGDVGKHIASASGEPYVVANTLIFNNQIYFLSTPTDGGANSPWVSDGTSAGTKPLAAIAQVGDLGESPELALVGKYVIFAQTTAASGRELWRIDTTDNSVAQVADIAPGAASGLSSYPRYASIGAAAVFIATPDGVTPGLWRTDGTAAGTYQIAPTPPNPSDPEFFAPTGTGYVIYFLTPGGVAQAWATDGSVAGTVQLPIPGVVQGDVHYVGTHFYFSSVQGTSINVWRSDGTVAGTAMIGGISFLSGANGSAPIEVAGDESKVFLRGNNAGGTGGSIYLYQPPSGAGTQLLTFASAQSGLFGYRNGLLYFNNADPVNGQQVWTSDGTVSGTHVLKNITPTNAAQTQGSYPGEFVGFNGLLYFTASDGNVGRELWASDGTTNRTRLVADLNPGVPDSNPTDLFVADGSLYLFALDGTNTYQLWRSDGTTAGTAPIAAVSPRPAPFRAPGCDSKGVAVGNIIYFAGYDASNGVQLWKTDGTAPGTIRLTSAQSTTKGSFGVCYLTALNGRIYFSAGDALSGFGNELWTSDGTPAGTLLVDDINPGAANSSPQFLTAFAGKLYFSADGGHGAALWASDGTAAGTTQQATFATGPVADVLGSSPSVLFVSATNGTTTDLWATAGNAGPPLSLVQGLTNVSTLVAHGAAYFAGSSGAGTAAAANLYVSQGTASTTLQILNLPGVSITPNSLADFHGITMFQTTDQSGTGNLWRTDGTSAGTQSLGNIATGTGGLAVGNNYFFAGDDGTTGPELWVIPNEAPFVPTISLGDVVEGQSITGNLLTGASDPDGSIDPQSLSIVQQPKGGTITLGANGAFTYTANSGILGPDQFFFSVADNQGYAISTGVALTVIAASNPSQPPPPPASSGGGGGSVNIVELLLLLGASAARVRRFSYKAA